MNELSRCAPVVSDDRCVALCFTKYERWSEFRFHIEFTATADHWREAYRETLAANDSWIGSSGNGSRDDSGSRVVVDGNVEAPAESDEFLDRITPLMLKPTVTTVTLVGGLELTASDRGRVSDVEFETNAFANVTSVKSIALVNIDLHRSIHDLLDSMPTRLKELDLSNTMMHTVPAKLQSFKRLAGLTLRYNYLTEWPQELQLEKLEELDLFGNSLTSFQANLPLLETLNLKQNTFATFPFSVFDLPKLRALRVTQTETAMTPVMFTPAQFAVILSMEEFEIDASQLDSTNCYPSEVRQFGQFSEKSVCVVEMANQKSTHNSTPPSSSSTNKQSPVLPIVFAIAGLATLILLATCFFYARRRRRQANDKLATGYTDYVQHNDTGTASRSQQSQPYTTTSTTSHWQTADEFKLARLRFDKLAPINMIATGSDHTASWLVRYSPTNQLLVSKRLVGDHITTAQINQFATTIKLAITLQHPNIVELVGVAWTNHTDLQALYEYMPGGDLQTHLAVTRARDQQPPTLWDEHKLRLAMDIVEALVYTHSFDPPLLHRNLTSRAVLLTEGRSQDDHDNRQHAKLSDFYQARYESERGTMTTSGIGSMRWLAPEVLSGSSSYTASSDIYSLGVVLCELDTSAVPYEEVVDAGGVAVSEVELARMVLAEGYRPRLSEQCPESLRRLIQQCLDPVAEQRPQAVNVAYMLRQIVSSLPQTLAETVTE